MPCLDIFANEDAAIERNRKIYELENKIEFLEASLCNAMKVLDEHSLKIDYSNAGIDRNQLRRWWYNHKRKDARKQKRF